jgi:hypothetical protein
MKAIRQDFDLTLAVDTRETFFQDDKILNITLAAYREE